MRFLTLLLFPFLINAATYYIDYVGGSDDSTGLTKATAWKHAPGMTGASGSVVTYENAHNNAQGTLPAGDAFIFKGGVTWTNDCFGWGWVFGGGTGWSVGDSAVYFGVDVTWYTGESWSRPVLDAETEPVADNGDISHTIWRCYKGTGGYFIVDNFEFKGLYKYDNTESFMLNMQCTKSEVKNCYFHGWGHTAVYNDGPCNDYGDGKTYQVCNRWTAGPDADEYCVDNFVALSGPYGSEDEDVRFHDCVFDGSDASPIPGDMGATMRGYITHFYHNYVAYAQNYLTSHFCGYVWENTFKELVTVPDVAANTHHNLYQAFNNVSNKISYVYNNYSYHISGGATYLWYPPNTCRFYAFNNISWDDSNQVVQLGNEMMTSSDNNSGFFIWNNTFQSYNVYNLGIVNTSQNGYYFKNYFIKNNHFIAATKSLNIGVMAGHLTSSDTGYNVFQTVAEALSDGYSFSSTYPLYPPSDGATVGAAQDISFLADSLVDLGPSTPSTAFLYDATMGVALNETNHTVSYPYRTPILRNNDVGAFEYGTSTRIKKRGCVLK